MLREQCCNKGQDDHSSNKHQDNPSSSPRVAVRADAGDVMPEWIWHDLSTEASHVRIVLESIEPAIVRT